MQGGTLSACLWVVSRRLYIYLSFHFLPDFHRHPLDPGVGVSWGLLSVWELEGILWDWEHSIRLWLKALSSSLFYSLVLGGLDLCRVLFSRISHVIFIHLDPLDPCLWTDIFDPCLASRYAWLALGVLLLLWSSDHALDIAVCGQPGVSYLLCHVSF